MPNVDYKDISFMIEICLKSTGYCSDIRILIYIFSELTFLLLTLVKDCLCWDFLYLSPLPGISKLVHGNNSRFFHNFIYTKKALRRFEYSIYYLFPKTVQQPFLETYTY